MIDAILSSLTHVRKSGAGYQARCPAHRDRGPSLSLREGDDGLVLVHCHAGCTTAAVVAALGLSMADLFPKTRKPRRPPPAPGVSRRELREAVDHERAITFIVACDRRKGRIPSADDLARERLARQRIALGARLL